MKECNQQCIEDLLEELPISDKLSVKASCQEGKGDKSRGSLARFGRGDLTIPKSRFSGT
ncbi:hypothetical protein IQ238_23285, partial [Pleurocapsales cyanobacterium LEGE 06147]|nr:hypothetical protein [Pleurocapsales cyanobacterium LEGE 06147]